MIGDRLNTDVAFGNDGGCTTVLVMTGCTNDAAAAAAEGREVPNHIFASIADLLPAAVHAAQQLKDGGAK
jgi:ribonucleotide monophosphatase NagD (HAD superfamily)